MLCDKLDCQEGSNFLFFSYQIHWSIRNSTPPPHANRWLVSAQGDWEGVRAEAVLSVSLPRPGARAHAATIQVRVFRVKGSWLAVDG